MPEAKTTIAFIGGCLLAYADMSMGDAQSEFERTGKEFVGTVYAYEVDGKGKSYERKTLHVMSIGFAQIEGAYACWMHSKNYHTDLCWGGVASEGV